MKRSVSQRLRAATTMGILGALGVGVLAVVELPASADVPSPPAAVNPNPSIVEVATPGPTPISGQLAKDTVWGPQGSPYVISGTYVIPVGKSLTVLPGTVIKMANDANVAVWGQALIVGEPDDRVTITSIQDDSVGGDTNGDGSATTAARGLWKGWDIYSSQGGAKERPFSAFDYADIRYGAKGPTMLCQYGMVNAVATGTRLVVSNSNLTDAQGAGVTLQNMESDAFVGVYDNDFDNSACGLGTSYGQGEVVGNTFDTGLSKSIFANNPGRVTLQHNTLKRPFTAVTYGNPSNMVVQFNDMSGGVANYAGASSNFNAFGPNWWGSNVNNPLPSCLSASEASSWQPEISFDYDPTCPAGKTNRPTGYKKAILPAMSSAPAARPSALFRTASPTFGPVNTLDGSLTWSVDDLALTDAGEVLAAARTYSSRDPGESDAGTGWRTSFDERMSDDNGTPTMGFADGESVPFGQDPAAGFVPAQGVSANFSSDASGSSVTTPDRTTYSFNTNGVLSKMTLDDPGREIDVNHTAGHLSSVTGSSGRSFDYSRNGDGRLETLTDSEGRTVHFSYDSDDRLVEVEGVDGVSEFYDYDGPHLNKVTSGSGLVKLAVGYDSEDRVSWIEQQGTGRATIDYVGNGIRRISQADETVVEQKLDAHGRLVTQGIEDRPAVHFVYDGQGRVVSQIAGIPTTPLTGFSAIAAATLYDSKGDPVRQVDPDGRGTTTVYNSSHQPTKVTTADGAATTYAYTDGRVSSVTDARGGVWALTHNSRGQLASVTDPLNRERTYTYQSDGDLESATDEFGETTTSENDTHGWTTASVDPLDRRTEYTYATWGQPKSVKRPTGGLTTAVFNDDHQVTKLTDPRGGETTYTYDPGGRLTKVADAAGGETSTTYDSLGRPDVITDVRGFTHARHYSPEGWPTKVDGPNSTNTKTAYDPAGRPIRQTNELGNVTQTLLDRSGRVASVQTPDSAATRSYRYDAVGRQTKYTDATARVWTATYDLTGNLKGTTDPASKTTSRDYDAVGRLTKVTDEAGVETTYTFDDEARTTTATDPLGILSIEKVDAAGQLIRTTDGEGGHTDLGYNPDGLVASVTNPIGGTTTYERNAAGLVTSQMDPADHTISATYDALGRTTARTYPDESDEAFAYDPAGNLTSRGDRRGHDWTYTFDAFNRATKETNPLADETTYEYDAAGNRTKTTDPSGIAERVGYDPVGRPSVVSDPSDASSVTAYDPEGRIVSVSDPAGVKATNTYDPRGLLSNTAFTGGLSSVLYTYDAVGRQLTRKQSSQTYTRGYDSRGNQTASIDPLGKLTAFTFDLANQPTSQTSPSSHTTTWGYDAAGNVTSATDPLNHSATYDYNDGGQLTDVHLPGVGDYAFAYDADGHISSQTNPIGQSTEYDWNPTGQLQSTTYPSGRQVTSTWDALGRETNRSAGSTSRTFGYDATGRLTSAAAGSQSVELTYDNRGLLDSSTDGQGLTDYAFDAAGRVSSVALPAGGTSTYSYNGYGSVATIRGPTNLNFGYDSLGRLTSTTNQTGTTNAAETFTYDLASHQTSAKYASTNSGFTATYTDDGQTASINQTFDGITNPSEGLNTFTYDAAGRITGSTLTSGGSTIGSTAYGWDEDSNRTSNTTGSTPAVTTEYDAAGRMAGSSDGASYSYNDDGQLTGIDHPSGDDSSYEYNAFGEVESSTVGSTTVNLTRDALGRIATRSDGTSTSGFGYDALSSRPTVIDTGGSDIALIRNADGQLLSSKSGSTVRHALANPHGDLAAWRNNTGAILNSTALYDPFGNATATGTDSLGLGFQSMPDDPVTGLVDMGARSYDAATSRFTSEDDVIGDLTAPITLNRYLYANGSPLDYFDPDGHFGLPKFITNIAKSISNGVKAIGNAASNAVNTVSNAISSAGRNISNQYSAERKAIGSTARSLQQGASRFADDLSAGASQLALDWKNTTSQLSATFDSQALHTTLDVAGLIPVVGEVADGANAAIYLLEGDTANALISMAAVVPVVGGAATSLRLAAKADNALDSARTARGFERGENAIGTQSFTTVHQGAAAKDGSRLTSRTDGLAGALDPIARNSRTSAAMSTRQGTDVLAGGGRDLSPLQRALARGGDVLGRSPGAHAEITAMDAAGKAGLTPWQMAVSRPICPACQAAIEGSGGTVSPGGMFAGWPR